MGIRESVQRWMGKVNPGVMRVVEKGLKSVPGVQGRIDKEYDGLLGNLEASLKPYRKDFATFSPGRPFTIGVPKSFEIALLPASRT